MKCIASIMADRFMRNISNSNFINDIISVNANAYPMHIISQNLFKADLSGKYINLCQKIVLKRKSEYINAFSLSGFVLPPASK